MKHSGEIWIANLNPAKGTEPGKTRPVVILQSQVLLEIDHPSTVVLPLTTQLIDGAEPLRLRIPARDRLRADSDVLIDQPRAIDNHRLVDGPIAGLTPDELSHLRECLSEVLGIDD